MPTYINFSNSADVRRWLSDKPREVAIVFAARAALRVAPLLRALGPRGGGAAAVGRDIVLPAFGLAGKVVREFAQIGNHRSGAKNMRGRPWERRGSVRDYSFPRSA